MREDADEPRVSRLPELATTSLGDPIAPQALVTFLNRTLKRRGLIFGIARQGGGLQLTVYETRPWAREQAASPPIDKPACGGESGAKGR